MNILFLSIGDVTTLKMGEHGVYTDLVRGLHDSGHEVYVACCREKKTNKPTEESIEAGIHVLRIKTGNITKTNIVEKGISTLTIGYLFENAIIRFWGNVHFNLVLYSTPPITLTPVIKWAKKKYSAKTYLMLKDIFPQNAIDIGMISMKGIKGLIYKYFRKQEVELYNLSDYIGCMSTANIEYLVKHNRNISREKVGLCPNAISIIDMSVTEQEKIKMREKYGIPIDKTVFLYGGNLGKPQGIPFLIECLQQFEDIEDAYFLIIGSGTDYHLVENYINTKSPKRVKLMKMIPKKDYEKMVGSCDVGMLFLDYRFTIPNFPSRLLDYMQAKIPVIAFTDLNTDVGLVIEKGQFGWWSNSKDAYKAKETLLGSLKCDLNHMGDNAFEYLKRYYDISVPLSSIKSFLES